MLRAGLVGEMGIKKEKLLGSNIVRAIKSGGQSCNIPPTYDEMVLKCLLTYLLKR